MPLEAIDSAADGPQVRRLNGVHGDEFRLAVQRERVISLAPPGTVIGWRFETALFDAQGPARTALLDWRDAERVDFAVLAAALEGRAGVDAQPLFFLPVAFSTLSSRQGRRDLSERLYAATTALGRRPALEVHGLAGVPPARLTEVTTLIRPACAGVIAEVTADRAELAGIGHCGLAGYLIRTQSAWSADPDQMTRFQGLTELARSSASICLARGRDADQPVLAVAGFSHAALPG